MTTKSKYCGCRKRWNDALAKEGPYEVGWAFTFGGEQFTLVKVDLRAGEKKPRGKSPPNLIASYCPFCGVKWPSKKEPAHADE
jgi:hypothetical protein